ncbi:MAG: DNA cytosine methyltransferase [bacterium]
MKVLVACEFSGIVRDAFIARGHDAVSCDLLPTEAPGPHYQGDVRGLLGEGWDLMIAHPPCTYLASSGARWWPDRQAEQRDALKFVCKVRMAPIPRIAIENPVGLLSTAWRKPDQYIQPWEHGHGETKKTGLWLKNLPLLKPSNIVPGRKDNIHKMPPSKGRSHLRSLTYAGIAAAMADQWGV